MLIEIVYRENAYDEGSIKESDLNNIKTDALSLEESGYAIDGMILEGDDELLELDFPE